MEVIRFLDAIDSEAEAAKKEVSKHWDENIKQVRGEQWRIKRSPYFLANIIRNQVRRKVAALTESRPQIQVSANRPSLSKSATILYNVSRSLWDQNRMEDAIYRLCVSGMTFGCGFVQTTYDPVADDIGMEFLDPRRVYLDTGITTGADLHKAQYIRVDTVMPLTDIHTRFPGRGLLVKPDDRFSSINNREARKSGTLSSILNMMPRPYRPGQPSKDGPIKRAEVRTYWIADPHINTEGKKLFPGGRYIARCGNVVLTDTINPYWDGVPPIDMFEWDVDYESPWGQDEIQDLRRLQEAINRIGDSWVSNLLLGSNFRIIGDLDALDPDQWDKLDNEAGLVIRKKPQRELRYDPPVPADPNTPQAIENLIRLCDMLTGNLDPTGQRRQAPSSALDGLQQASQALVRSVARRLESTLERVGQKLIARIFQFYTSDRIVFQLGPSREWIAYTYERQQLLKDDAGKFRDPEDLEKHYRDYRFMITPGSSLSQSRIQRTMAALQLRSATGVAPSIRRILQESDLGDPDTLIEEGLAELSRLPQPPPPKGKGGRS